MFLTGTASASVLTNSTMRRIDGLANISAFINNESKLSLLQQIINPTCLNSSTRGIFSRGNQLGVCTFDTGGLHLYVPLSM